MQLFESVLHLFHPRRSNNHRAKLVHPDSIFSLLCIVIGFSLFIYNVSRVSPELGSVLGYASDISVAQVIQQTNEQRAALKLSPLRSNATLSAAAAAKAADMFANQYWSHVSPKGKQPWDFMKQVGYRYSSAGENLARDFGTTPEMIHAWMNSPTHRANIVNAKYQEIGVAVVNGNLQGMDTTLVVQMFGKPPVSTAPKKAKISDAAVATPEVAGVSIDEKVSPTEQSNTEEIVATLISPVPEQADAEQSIAPESLVSPLMIIKSALLSILGLIILTLTYDAYVSSHKNTVRMVGQNFAHILYLVAISIVVVWFKSGVIK
ncbi:hypothetical protein KA082_00075 [Candidatus Woesebacteria bacterium]|nr:hypothetical protein [Candidatus Woesebacteria bacterium]